MASDLPPAIAAWVAFLKAEIVRTEEDLARWESGEIKMATRTLGGEAVDLTQQEIEHGRRAIETYKAIIAKHERPPVDA